MSTDQVVALMASIAACLSAIASFFAIRQNAKQRAASYRPILAIPRIGFSGSPDPLVKNSMPTRWLKENAEKFANNPDRESLAITLHNVGLGTAKELKLAWSFDIEEMIDISNQHAQESLISRYFSLQNGILEYKSEDAGQSASMWCNQQHFFIDYILPVSTDQSGLLVHLPHAYIMLFSSLMQIKSLETAYIEDIPPLQLSIEYKDIGEEKHKAIFSLAIRVSIIQPDTFHATLEAV